MSSCIGAILNAHVELVSEESEEKREKDAGFWTRLRDARQPVLVATAALVKEQVGSRSNHPAVDHTVDSIMHKICSGRRLEALPPA